MATTVYRNVRIWDASRDAPVDGEVLVEDDRIVEVSDQCIEAAEANVIDGRGGVLMPGLIDCHCHVMVSDVNPRRLEDVPPTLMTAMAAETTKDLLMRGFTSIRDCGGADWGLAAAIERGLFPGPRVFASGRALSQTGGHGDFRRRTASGLEPCGCSSAAGYASRIADGITGVRQAARDELRLGASQIKVMVSGGVASPHDPIDNRQYSAEELRAIVEEAAAWNTYVAAHSYTSASTTHAVECGVRTIEHGNLIDAATARLMARRDAFLVPTLAAFDVLERIGPDLGLPPASLAKASEVSGAGRAAIELCRAAGTKIGFGSDLLGAFHDMPSRGLVLQAEAQTNREVLASATAVNAEILNRSGTLGVIAEGAKADILVVAGDPPRRHRASRGAGPEPLRHHAGRPPRQERARLTRNGSTCHARRPCPAREFRQCWMLAREFLRILGLCRLPGKIEGFFGCVRGNAELAGARTERALTRC